MKANTDGSQTLDSFRIYSTWYWTQRSSMSISSAPCDTIQKYVPVLYRYQLKLEDLEQMNWTVVYPPEGEN